MTAASLPAPANDILLSLTALLIQSAPFLLIGVLFSAAMEKILPHGLLPRLLVKAGPAQYPLAALSGAVLPVCECAALPVSMMLYRTGVPLPCVVVFLLASPAINPVALASTWAAFQGRSPELVTLTRVIGGVLTALVAGLIAGLLRKKFVLRDAAYGPAGTPETPTTWMAAAQRATRDFLDLMPFLVSAATLTSVLTTLVPHSVLTELTESPLQGILLTQIAAFTLSLCSSSDAFIVAPLAMSMESKLAFLLLGPVVDLKLVILYAAFFSRRFIFVLIATVSLTTGMLAWTGGRLIANTSLNPVNFPPPQTVTHAEFASISTQ